MQVSGKSSQVKVSNSANILQYGVVVCLHGCHNLFSSTASDSDVDVERSEQVGSYAVSSFGTVLQHHRVACHNLQAE